MSNEADQLCHPVRPNVDKHQKKSGRLYSLKRLRRQETGIRLCTLCLQARPPRFWLKNFLFDALPIFSIFFCHNFHYLLLPRHNRRTLKDAISRIQGSCNCDGRKLGDKNRSRKNRKRGSIFLHAIFVTQPLTSK